MSKYCHQRLRARVDEAPLPAEGYSGARTYLLFGCELRKPFVADRKRQAGVTPLDRMTDAIAFRLVEENHLIGFRDSFVAAQMAVALEPLALVER